MPSGKSVGETRIPSYTWLGHAYAHDIWKMKHYEELGDWEVYQVK